MGDERERGVYRERDMERGINENANEIANDKEGKDKIQNDAMYIYICCEVTNWATLRGF